MKDQLFIRALLLIFSILKDRFNLSSFEEREVWDMETELRREERP